MDPSSSSEDLMAAVQAGQLDALAPLFERHHRPLFGYVRGRTLDRHRAEDVVQETFARILRYRTSYRPGSPFVPWLLQIARNLLRADRPRERTTVLEEAKTLASQDDQEADLERQQRREQVLAGLAELTADERDLLLLSHVQDLPREEIAKLLGITTNAAKVRIHRAITALRQRVHKAENGEATP